MAKTINNWCPQGIVHSVQMDCSFRRNDGKNDNRSNRNGTTLLALDCFCSLIQILVGNASLALQAGGRSDLQPLKFSPLNYLIRQKCIWVQEFSCPPCINTV